jgi:hypothetical protein
VTSPAACGDHLQAVLEPKGDDRLRHDGMSCDEREPPCRAMVLTARTSSIHANESPMQRCAPPPNGKYANGDRDALNSGVHRSGMKRSSSEKNRASCCHRYGLMTTTERGDYVAIDGHSCDASNTEALSDQVRMRDVITENRPVGVAGAAISQVRSRIK